MTEPRDTEGMMAKPPILKWKEDTQEADQERAILALERLTEIRDLLKLLINQRDPRHRMI